MGVDGGCLSIGTPHMSRTSIDSLSAYVNCRVIRSVSSIKRGDCCRHCALIIQTITQCAPFVYVCACLFLLHLNEAVYFICFYSIALLCSI